jgi:hypothetical protein
MKPLGKPDAGNPHVRFDERGRETAPACWGLRPSFDSTKVAGSAAAKARYDVEAANGGKGCVFPITEMNG